MIFEHNENLIYPPFVNLSGDFYSRRPLAVDGLRSYLSDVGKTGGRSLKIAGVFVGVGTILEGIGLFSIIPFLAIVAEQNTGPLGERLINNMKAIGLTSRSSQLASLSLGIFLLLCLRGWVHWSRDVRLQKLGLGYVDLWRQRLMYALSAANWPTVDRLRRGDLIHAITTDVARLSIATSSLLRTLASAGLAFVQIGVVAILSPRLFLVVVGLALIGILIAQRVSKHASLLGRNLSISGRKAQGGLHDFLSAQKLARLSNAQTLMVDHYIHAVQKTRQQNISFNSLQSGSRALYQIFGGAIALLTFWIGYTVLDTPIAILALTIIVMIRTVGPIQSIASTLQQLAHALPAYKDLTALLGELEANQSMDVPERVTKTAHRSGPPSITLNNIAFKYDQSDRPVLANVSLDISAGEFVALTGESGVGKTTLLDILTGLQRPHSGEVLVDDICLLSERDFHNWRDRIAYLPQNPFLFDGTIRENLVWNLPQNITDAQLWEALERAGAKDCVDKRGAGLDLKVGERGESLSGGERQLVCLARAILKNPDCLILDEATSSLDQGLEQIFLDRLSALENRPTILFVTHKTDIMKFAERCFQLSSKGITERQVN